MQSFVLMKNSVVRLMDNSLNSAVPQRRNVHEGNIGPSVSVYNLPLSIRLWQLFAEVSFVQLRLLAMPFGDDGMASTTIVSSRSIILRRQRWGWRGADGRGMSIKSRGIDCTKGVVSGRWHRQAEAGEDEKLQWGWCQIEVSYCSIGGRMEAASIGGEVDRLHEGDEKLQWGWCQIEVS